MIQATIAIGTIGLATLMVLKPKIDKNSETDDYLLWYNSLKGRRKYVIIWKSIK